MYFVMSSPGGTHCATIPLMPPATNFGAGSFGSIPSEPVQMRLQLFTYVSESVWDIRERSGRYLIGAKFDGRLGHNFDNIQAIAYRISRKHRVWPIVSLTREYTSHAASSP